MMEAIDDFEIDAVALKETETALLRMKTGMAHEAVSGNKVRWLANLWGCSAQAINTWARMFKTFDKDEITPDIPLSLWNAVMETGNPQAWLERAIAEGLSARQVRDANDNLKLKGKHLSRCQFAGEVEVLEWEPATGRFAVTGLRISGDAPVRARVTVQEVLEKETDDTND